MQTETPQLLRVSKRLPTKRIGDGGLNSKKTTAQRLRPSRDHGHAFFYGNRSGKVFRACVHAYLMIRSINECKASADHGPDYWQPRGRIISRHARQPKNTRDRRAQSIPKTLANKALLTRLGDGNPLLLHGLEQRVRVTTHLVELVDAARALVGKN